MANKLTLIRHALLARLSTITPANDYRTEAGANVRSGWLNELVKEKGSSFPLIVVQPGRDQQPTPGPGALKLVRGYDIVGAVSTQVEDYEAVLDELELDLLQALTPIPGVLLPWGRPHISSITLGAPTHYPPGDGMNAAAVLIPIYLHTVIEGRIP